jgi:hypothetical protein
MTGRPLRILVAALALAAAAAVPSAAFADPPAEQRAAAQALFDDARRLMADKRFADACPKLEESQRIDPGLGTLLNLAECQAQTGRTASAWANFLEAAYQARSAGQTKRENAARARAAALEPKLSRLTILAVVAGTKVEIKRDGSVVAPSLVGTAVPVDPGEHTISASAPGKQPWETKVTVSTDGRQFSVSVPQLEDAAARPAPPLPQPEVTPPPPLPQAPPPEGAPPPLPPTPPVDVSTGKGPRAAGIVLTVLGAGGLAVGAAFAALAKQKLDDSNANGACKGDLCNTTGAGLRNTARTDGDVATGAIIGGSVVAAGGVGLLIAAAVMGKGGGKPVPAVSVSVDPRGGASIGLSGRF